jgi:hypothetical protein
MFSFTIFLIWEIFMAARVLGHLIPVRWFDMRPFVIIATVLLLLWTASIHSEAVEADNIHHQFIQSGNYYLFNGTTFFATSDPDCLIHILYDFQHLRKINILPDSIVLLREGEYWYEVSYHYRNLFFESRATYRRALKQGEKKVTFEMRQCEQRGLHFPKIVSSTGYYEIKPEKEGFRLTYFEEGEIADHLLKEIYFQWVEKEAFKFLHRLKDYVNKTCPR